MPGIFGFFYKYSQNIDHCKSLIAGMNDRLSHYKSYKSNMYHDSHFGLGNIGIPNLNESNFHVDSADEYAVAFSGYIYGWKIEESFFKSPPDKKAERILELYHKKGNSFVELIDGSFNVVIIDLKKYVLNLYTDRIGHRQLYYYDNEEIFIFSTEMKSILEYEKFDRKLDRDAITDYFNFTYLLGNKTFFADIKRFPGGHYLAVDKNKSTFNKYWDFYFDNELRPENTSEHSLVDELHSLYPDIIKKHTRGYSRALIPLSGGLDSRFILAHAAALDIELHVFTHGTRNCTDHVIAREVAECLGIKNYGFIEIEPEWVVEYNERFVYLIEGMIESSSSILLGISDQYGLDSADTVFLNGIFGGPTNFGNSYFRNYDFNDKLSHHAKLLNLKRSLFGDLLKDFFYKLFSPGFRELVKTNYMKNLDEEFQTHGHVSEYFRHQKDCFFIKNRLRHCMDQIDCNRYIWHDHFSLADNNLLDFYLKMPSEYKLNRKLMKAYFINKYPELAAIQYQATGVNLYKKPNKYLNKLNLILNRYKQSMQRLSGGYINFYDRNNYKHFSQWFRTNKKVGEFYSDIILDKKTIERGYFDKKAMENLLNYQRKGGDVFYMISSLVSFEIFQRLFIDSK